MLRKFVFVFIAYIFLISSAYAVELEFNFFPKTPKQGDTLKVTINCTQKIKQGTIYFAGKRFTIFDSMPQKKGDYNYVSYIGISRRLKPKKRPIKLRVKLFSGKKYWSRKTIITKDGRFKSERLTLPTKKRKLQRQTKLLRKENRTIAYYFKKITRKPYFKGRFKRPAKGRVTSSFGANRVYNGKITWQHSGVDFSKKQGSYVYATNSGKVIMTKTFSIHGKMLMIDHGFGIISSYMHLRNFKVAKGQYVKRGQIIGVIGSTGIATGPHLHWGMSVQNVRVNPMFWLDNNL